MLRCSGRRGERRRCREPRLAGCVSESHLGLVSISFTGSLPSSGTDSELEPRFMGFCKASMYDLRNRRRVSKIAESLDCRRLGVLRSVLKERHLAFPPLLLSSFPPSTSLPERRTFSSMGNVPAFVYVSLVLRLRSGSDTVESAPCETSESLELLRLSSVPVDP